MAAESPAGPLSAGTVEADAAARAVSPVADELLALRGSPGFCTNSWRCIMISLALSAPSPHTHGHVEVISIRVPITVHLAATGLGIRALKSAISFGFTPLPRAVEVPSLAVSPGSGGRSKSRRNCGAVAGRARPPFWRPPRRSGPAPYTACQREVSRRRKTRVHSGHGTWDASKLARATVEQACNLRAGQLGRLAVQSGVDATQQPRQLCQGTAAESPSTAVADIARR